MPLWEAETHLRASLRDLPRALSVSALLAGGVATVLVLTVPTIIVYQAASVAHLSLAETRSWLWACYAGAGVMGLVLTLVYRQPIAAGVSVPVAAMLVQTLPHFTFAEAVGAYLLSGAMISAVAFSGLYERLMHAIPREIMMGLVAGVMLRFGLGIFGELAADPVLIVPTVVAWLVALRWLATRVPPVAAALAVGATLAVLLRSEGAGPIGLAPVLPAPVWPVFTLDGFLSLSIPIMLLLLSAQNAPSIGVLWSYEFRAPVNAITLASGVVSLLIAPFGGHGANLATPRIAIIADPSAHADPRLRYGAGVVAGVLMLLGAAFAGTVVDVVAFLPAGLMRTVAGLGLVPVILQALQRSAGAGRFRLGSLFALFIAGANVQFLGISSIFWALVLAPLLSRFVDPDWRVPGGR